jgi:hypothetical protein
MAILRTLTIRQPLKFLEPSTRHTGKGDTLTATGSKKTLARFLSLQTNIMLLEGHKPTHGAKDMKKKITKTVTHDRLAVKAQYPSGGTFTFSITRSGDRLAWGGSNDTATAKAEMKKFMAWAEAKDKTETHGERIERIAAKAEQANTIAELIASL